MKWNNQNKIRRKKISRNKMAVYSLHTAVRATPSWQRTVGNFPTTSKDASQLILEEIKTKKTPLAVPGSRSEGLRSFFGASFLPAMTATTPLW